MNRNPTVRKLILVPAVITRDDLLPREGLSARTTTKQPVAISDTPPNSTSVTRPSTAGTEKKRIRAPYKRPGSCRQSQQEDWSLQPERTDAARLRVSENSLPQLIFP